MRSIHGSTEIFGIRKIGVRSLYPSPTFPAKNQLAREGPSCVAPVIIPALAPSLDKSFKKDKSLSGIRALC